MTVYFDTSALMKLVVQERETPLAEEIWASGWVAVANPLAYVEVRAAIAAATRAGRVSAVALRAAVRYFDQIWGRVLSVGMDEEVTLAAGDLAERHSLRGGDALHLASALSIEGTDVVVATWDRELSRAASAAGCAVVP